MDKQRSAVAEEHHPVDTSDLSALFVEGTLSTAMAAVDDRIMLWATPEQTLAHRKARARCDELGGVLDEADSVPVTALVHDMHSNQALPVLRMREVHRPQSLVPLELDGYVTHPRR